MSKSPLTFTDEDGVDITPFFMRARAVRYDAQGRITNEVDQGMGFTSARIEKGEPWLFGTGELDPETQTSPFYVDTSGTRPEITPRPIFEGAFTKAKVPVNVESTIKALPACTISFDGPETGTHEHAGGDLVIGFVSPGTYTISGEPFPYLPITRTLTVTP